MTVSTWSAICPDILPKNVLGEWLEEPDILSLRMKEVCDVLSVRLMSQKIETVLEEEQLALFASPHDSIWLRQIFLEGDGVPWCYARVSIPEVTYEHHFEAFDTLGNHLLGETILYPYPGMKKGALQIKSCHKGDELYVMALQQIQKAYPMLSIIMNRKYLWSRRRVFWLDDNPLLVTEVFLPTIPHYPI